MAEQKHDVHEERYAVLKEMLEDRRRDIHDRLRLLRETLPAQVLEVKDAEEQSVQDFAQDVELALMEMKSETLGQIDEAVRRLEAGTSRRCPSRPSAVTARKSRKRRAPPSARRTHAC
jgi:RNA polymerase-binding transcription factor DksA